MQDPDQANDPRRGTRLSSRAQVAFSVTLVLLIGLCFAMFFGLTLLVPQALV